MKKQQPLTLAITLFIIVLVVVFVLIFGIGKAYRSNLSVFTPQSPQEETKLAKKLKINKIRVRDGDNCYELTPDGVVRVYEGCTSELTDAARPADSKHILELFRLASETDLSAYQTGGEGKLYELTIETDEGTKTISIVLNENSGSVVTQIVTVITQIQQDIPRPSPSTASSPLPPGATPQPSPVSSLAPGQSPLPSTTPAPGASDTPFTCNFTEGGQAKPYRVSNVVCTDEPQ